MCRLNLLISVAAEKEQQLSIFQKKHLTSNLSSERLFVVVKEINIFILARYWMGPKYLYYLCHNKIGTVFPPLCCKASILI